MKTAASMRRSSDSETESGGWVSLAAMEPTSGEWKVVMQPEPAAALWKRAWTSWPRASPRMTKSGLSLRLSLTRSKSVMFAPV